MQTGNQSGNNRHQDVINEGNKRKNCKRKYQTYKQGDKILLKKAWKTKFNLYAYIGLYVIKAVRNNSTVRARKGRVMETFNF